MELKGEYQMPKKQLNNLVPDIYKAIAPLAKGVCFKL